MDLVSVVIPTLDRPQRLQRALASVLAQEALHGIAVEIVVVDNSISGSALPTLAAQVEKGVRALHARHPGVAHARNVGVNAARGRWVAFLDDDEEASPRWLSDLLAVARRTDADAVFGPIEGRAEDGREIGAFSPYFSREIDRRDGADVTDLAAYLGTNNSLFAKARCFERADPFDVSLNQSGGEDSLLLWRLKQGGRRFAWAAGARVIEWAPPRRLSWSYVRKRKFLSGQIRVFVRHMASPLRWDLVAVWMGVGLAQFVVAGVAALALAAFAPARSGQAQATAFGGLGKVLWLKSFRPALYGGGLVS